MYVSLCKNVSVFVYRYICVCMKARACVRARDVCVCENLADPDSPRVR